MNDDGAQRTHAVFMRALDIEAPARGRYIDEACGGDTALRQRVMRLVGAVERSAGFLETPALGDRRAPSEPGPIRVRGYRVQRVIGAGGMATVYEAIQEQPERRVALKVMNRALGSSSAVRRFAYETETLARLQHPRIAQIFEAGTCDDGLGHATPFFAMEYIAGARTLIEHARALPLRARLEMLAEVCDGVQHGHTLGVVHRDLKPGNILVDAEGRARIIDFGVARSSDPERSAITHHAEAGQLIGTLNYMSPEQCAGRGNVDARADVYSLGVILFELTAGRLPHDLSGVPLPEAVRTIMDGVPPRLSSLAPTARGDLDAIVLKAMAKEPDRRYASAGALATDIRRFLNHQTIEARSPSTFHQACLFARRHRVLVGAGATVALTLLASTVLVGLFAYRTSIEAEARGICEREALVERDAARLNGYVAGIEGAFAASRTGEVARARRRLAALPRELRHWEWRLADALSDRGERTIATFDDMVYAMVLSPDGTRLAVGSRDGSISLRSPDTGARSAEVRPAGDPGVFCLAFSRDGGLLVSGSDDGAVRVWDGVTGAPVRTITAGGSRVEEVSFGPGDTVGAARRDGTAHVWSAATGALVRTIDDQPGGVHGLRFSPDGSVLATWSHHGDVRIRAGDDGAVRFSVSAGPSPDVRLECGAFSADGTLFAVGGAGGRVCVWATASGELLHELTTAPSTSTVNAIAFSPSGRTLYAGQIDRNILHWTFGDNERRDARMQHEEAIAALAFSSDGSRLISASWDRTIRTWPIGSAAGAGPLTVLRGHRDLVLSVSISPDDSLIASAGRDDVVHLWDPEMGMPLATLDAGGGDAMAAVFSPDGRLLATAAAQGTVLLWRAETATVERTLAVDAGEVCSLAFSPDGATLIAGNMSGLVRAWDTKSGRELIAFRAHDERVSGLAFSPAGDRLATCSRDTLVKTWRVPSFEHERTFRGHRLDVFAVAFTPDGQGVYSGSRDQTVREWRLDSELVHLLDAQGQFVTCLGLSQDGRRLFAGSWFGDVAIWDRASRTLVATFKGHNSAIRSIGVSRSADFLVCGGHDADLNLYDARPREARMGSRARASAELAKAESWINSRAGLSDEDLLARAKADEGPERPGLRWIRNVLLLRRAPTASGPKL